MASLRILYYSWLTLFRYFGGKKTLPNNHYEIKGILKSAVLAIIRYRIFCLPVCYPKIQTLKYTEL